MEVTITLTICLSVVFIFTLAFVSCTLRDPNFKVRFDKKNERLMEIIQDQRKELISYRDLSKKNDENLKKALEVLEAASDVINDRISHIKEGDELLARIKAEIGDFNVGKNKFFDKIDEVRSSFASSVEKIDSNNEIRFKHFETYLVNRPSYLSPKERKRFEEYLQACLIAPHNIANMDNKDDACFVTIEDVKAGLDCIGTDKWDLVFIPGDRQSNSCNNGQSTKRNQ